MSKAKISFFPVGNGDMSLIRLADKHETSILIDINIRNAADDPDDDKCDVAKELRSRIKVDGKKRPYVDVFLLSHPDQDHCSGLLKHFYLGKLDDYPDDNKAHLEKRIVIREIWSSPMVFKRADRNHKLCDDAKAFNKEAKRRVKVNRENNFNVDDGDRILIMGEDEDGKTDDLGKILIKVDSRFNKIRGSSNKFFEALLLGPRSSEDDETDDLLSKNHSSVIVNFKIAGSETELDGCQFLTGGDAEVEIWERVWKKYESSKEDLEYDLMQAPHHCSWHTLSHESWSKSGGKAKVSGEARSALAQARKGASIVSSSQTIKEDQDPPCIGAKKEYLEILSPVSGKFHCTSEYPNEKSPKPLEFEVQEAGGISVIGALSAIPLITSTKAPRAG